MDSLIRALRVAIGGRLDRPYALFGHSLGALIAFELAGELARTRAAAPMRVFLSACPAPAHQRHRRVLHTLSNAELLEEVRAMEGTPSEVLADRELMDMTLPILRADFALAETHNLATQALDCPITAFFGEADREAERDAVADWRAHARGDFTLQGFPGGHFFLDPCAPELLAAIERALQ
jgi:medium-chain acyl-[acyl-carrier-protein] hydrolase